MDSFLCESVALITPTSILYETGSAPCLVLETSNASLSNINFTSTQSYSSAVGMEINAKNTISITDSEF